MIKRKIDVEIDLSPAELAEQFCQLDSEMQALFFNNIKRITDQWDMGFFWQLQYITESERLTDGGRTIMRQIGEYAEKHEG